MPKPIEIRILFKYPNYDTSDTEIYSFGCELTTNKKPIRNKLIGN